MEWISSRRESVFGDSKEGGCVSDSEALQKELYDLVRRADGKILASYQFGPEDRVLFYRCGETFSCRPMKPDELIGDLSMFSEMLLKAGYRPSSLSDIVS